jgi:hypothetical protein
LRTDASEPRGVTATNRRMNHGLDYLYSGLHHLRHRHI